MVRTTTYVGLNNKAQHYIQKRFKRGTLVEISSANLVNRKLKIGENKTYYIDPFTYNRTLDIFDPENEKAVFFLKVFFDKVRQRVIYECEEASPWSGGPCVMTFLKDEFGNIIKCSSWGRFEGEEYIIYDTYSKPTCILPKEIYSKATYIG